MRYFIFACILCAYMINSIILCTAGFFHTFQEKWRFLLVYCQTFLCCFGLCFRVSEAVKFVRGICFQYCETIDLRSCGTQKIDDKKIHLSGFITRSDGRKMVWLNGKGFFDNETLPNGLTIGQPNTTLLTLPLGISLDGNSQKTNLKPGQTWQPTTGIINESFKLNMKMAPSPWY